MPFGKWKNWEACINDPDLIKRYPSLETRKKVCGSLQAKHKKDFDHKLIVEKYNELKLEHPEFDERRLLEEVFSRISNDFSFPETMSKSVGQGKIVKPKEKNKKVKICEDCKKEVESYFYKKLCEECYLKRVKHYIEVYDLQEDYPVSEHTRESGKVKVRAYTRGEGKQKEEIKEKIEKLKEEIKIAEKEIIGMSSKNPNKKKIIDQLNFNPSKIKNLEKKLIELDKPKPKPKKTEIRKEKYSSMEELHKESTREAKEEGKGIFYDLSWKDKAKKDYTFDDWMAHIHSLLFGLDFALGSDDEKVLTKIKKQAIRKIGEHSKLTVEEALKFKQLYDLIEIDIPKIIKEKLWNKDITLDFIEDLYIKKPIFIFDSVGEGFEFFANTFDFINLTEDEAVRRIESHIPSGKTRLQELWEIQKAYDKAVRLGKELGVTPSVSQVASITVPFSITNTETGKTMIGEVIENIDKNTKQLMPVSSSNVRASGQFGSELLVQFHPSKLQPMRTYRYMFETSEQASEANKSLTTSASPGRWVWQNLRGHIAGEKVTSSKLGPSLSPPGQGLPTIGGTSASLVPYKISNRAPVSRVKNFEEILREMKRATPNPTTNPLTGTRIESLLGARKELREMKEPGWRKGTHRLPPIGDFVYVGNLNEFEEDYTVKGHWRHLKSGKKTWIKGYERGERKLQEKKEIPLWKKIKNLRKRREILLKKSIEMEKKGQTGIEIAPILNELTLIKQELDIPKRKKHKQYIEQLKGTLEWAENAKEYDRKEIEFELELESKKGYKPNYTDTEWYTLLEQYEHWDERIRDIKESIEEREKELRKVEEFEKELFEDKITIKYTFDITLHKKLKIQKGLIKQIPYWAEDRINTINNAFYDLPRHLQDSCKQIRIFEKANDDPLYGTLKSCGGFYNQTEEYITIGLKTQRKDISVYTANFLKEATIHEAAHALDFTTLSGYENEEIMSFFDVNYQRLKNRKEYAATNKWEFFAEGYAKLYTGNHDWFRGLRKGTKGLFQDIMKKYDFIIDSVKIELYEKINGIKFSYQDGDNHIFGVYRIPEDITFIEADELVKEGKAQYENIDKYFKKEKEVDKNDKTAD